MELIELPKPLRNRGFTAWPQIYRVGRNDETPPPGIPYVRADKVDYPLVFRLLVPMLMAKHPYFDWENIYYDLTGKRYEPQRVYVQIIDDANEGTTYGASSHQELAYTLEELAAEDNTYVDIDMLASLRMLPTFMADIREAIAVNVTNNYAWEDGYNKKLGLCVGSLVEQPRAKNLVILDISGSIPDGVAAGMLTLIRTISDITNADLIVTGGKSFFYTNEEAKRLDIHEVRRKINWANEGDMFNEILRTHDMNYKNIICFGDSDNPESYSRDVETALDKLHIENIYSFFCMEHDTYGNYYKHGAGYCRWAMRACPTAIVHHKTDWAKFFNRTVDATW